MGCRAKYLIAAGAMALAATSAMACVSTRTSGSSPGSTETAACTDIALYVYEAPLPFEIVVGSYADAIARGTVTDRWVESAEDADGKITSWAVHQVDVTDTLKGAVEDQVTVSSLSECLEIGGEYYFLLEDRHGVEGAVADYVVGAQGQFKVADGEIVETAPSNQEFDGMSVVAFESRLKAAIGN